MVYENALNIYTDGSSLSHPRRGGIGVRYIIVDTKGNEIVQDETHTGFRDATSNQMELMACIKALEGACRHEAISVVDRVYIFTDSMYVTNNMNSAIYEWQKQKWLNRHQKPVANAELWKQLIRLKRRVPRRVDFKWVKGHSKNLHNRAVDLLAKESARGVLYKPLNVGTVRRKITKKTVETGSVGMHGQELSIRIIADTYLRVQRIYRYKYEVLSQESTYFGNVDWIYSELVLRSGHHYKVMVNDNEDNPRILKIVEELLRK
jgi:ribonuclease HI